MSNVTKKEKKKHSDLFFFLNFKNYGSFEQQLTYLFNTKIRDNYLTVSSPIITYSSIPMYIGIQYSLYLPTYVSIYVRFFVIADKMHLLNHQLSSIR